MLSDVRAKQDVLQEALQRSQCWTDVQQHRRVLAAGDAPAQKVNANANPAMEAASMLTVCLLNLLCSNQQCLKGQVEQMCTLSGFGSRTRSHARCHIQNSRHTQCGECRHNSDLGPKTFFGWWSV